MTVKIQVGDRVVMKKPHACGTNDFEVARTGMDIKLVCQACGRVLWMKRVDFNRKVRKVRLEDGSYRSVQGH